MSTAALTASNPPASSPTWRPSFPAPATIEEKLRLTRTPVFSAVAAALLNAGEAESRPMMSRRMLVLGTGHPPPGLVEVRFLGGRRSWLVLRSARSVEAAVLERAGLE